SMVIGSWSSGTWASPCQPLIPIGMECSDADEDDVQRASPGSVAARDSRAHCRNPPMSWLTDLLRSIAPPTTGIEVDDPDPISVPVGVGPGAFIRAIGILVDPDAVLYWEGGASRLLKAWLGRLTLESRPPVSVGVSPVADFYHVPLDPGVLDE